MIQQQLLPLSLPEISIASSNYFVHQESKHLQQQVRKYLVQNSTHQEQEQDHQEQQLPN
jgi:hypothetical protein